MLRILLSFVLVVGCAAHALADTRGALVLKPVDASAPLTLYGQSYALVIGIDAYANGWPRLSNAVRDAKAVADALQQRGFEVSLKTNLGSDDLERVIEDFIYERGNDPEARLMIWYAGHGHMIGDEAYLVPADAPAAQDDLQFRRKAMSMRDFGKFMREVRSKHVLAIFDSCFSGNVFETARAAYSAAITHAVSLPVRQMISSGESQQTVSDDGTFRRLFLDALSGDEPNADANKDGYLTGSELGLFLSDKITSLTNGRQSPRYGKLRELGFDRGDFVFQVGTGSEQQQSVEVAALPAPSPALPTETSQETAPEARSSQPSTGEELVLSGNQTVVLMDNRLTFSMIGTPFGARRDLVGVFANGKRKALAIGDSVTAAADESACSITLMQIVAGENKAQFLMQCGSPAAEVTQARASLALKLSAIPGTAETFTMSGGTSRVLQPGSALFAVIKTPYGARKDLVGVVLNGKRSGMAVGHQQRLTSAGKLCTLTATKLHHGENQADFLWRCE